MSGDTLDFFQGNRETLTGTLHDPAATPGDVLTVQADKSIAAQPGGGGGIDVFDGSTEVPGTTVLWFTSGAAVTDAGGGVAKVAVTAFVPESSVYASAASLTINNAASAKLPWAHQQGGAPLDLTDPTQPKFVDPGIYLVYLNFSATAALTAAGFIVAVFATGTLISPSIRSDYPANGVSLAASIEITDVTQPIYLELTNNDGASARDFALNNSAVTRIA